MDIAQLRTLLHVAELGSVSKAAERLGIAQPALSRQIRLLEAELGAPLFLRHGRGMLLTDLGRKILDPAHDIMSRMTDIRRLANQGSSAYTGRVRFGMTPTVAEVMTLPLATGVARDHPNLSLCFTTGYSGHLIDWLKRDQLDCCVSYDLESNDLVEANPVLEESLLLIGRGDDRLSMSRPVMFDTLRTMRLILPSPLHGLRRILDASAVRAGIALSPCIEVDSFGATVDLVRAGVGMAILPLAPVHDRVATQELCAAPLRDPAPVRRVMMVYPLDRPVSPAARLIGETFTRIACGLVASQKWSGRKLDAGPPAGGSGRIN